MRWMTLAVVVLLLAQPGKTVAGPPEKISGKLVFDEVEDGLRKYRAEKDWKKRIELLKRLAPKRDKRIEDVLETALSPHPEFGSLAVAVEAASLLELHYGHPHMDVLPVRRSLLNR